MGKAMQGMLMATVVPIVKKIVMQQGAADQSSFIYPAFQFSGQVQAETGNLDAVGIHAGRHVDTCFAHRYNRDIL